MGKGPGAGGLGPGKRRFGKGFTLLELLVVILIIGLLSAAVVLTLPERDDPRQMQRQAEQLVAQFRAARSEAVFGSRPMGAVLGENRSQIMVYGADGWMVVASGPLSRPLPLQTELRFEVIAEGSEINIAANNRSPQILFLNDGQVSAFQIQMTNPAGQELRITDTLRLEQEDDRAGGQPSRR